LSGSGKSTLARRLAAALDLDHIELDALYHGPGWQPAAPDVFAGAVAERLRGERWVVDGNYSAVRPVVWAAAHTVVWLDLPRRVVVPALVARTLRRGLRREVLWNGNVERPLQLLDPRREHNLLLWALHSYAVHQERYEELMVDPRWRHLRVVRLRRRAGVDRFVANARAWHGATSPPGPG